jgi:hypothetical protein
MGSLAHVLTEKAWVDKIAKESSDSAPIELKPGLKVKRAEIRDKIFSAAVASYETMRDEMKKKLTYALETREVEYYNAIARRKKGPT